MAGRMNCLPIVAAALVALACGRAEPPAPHGPVKVASYGPYPAAAFHMSPELFRSATDPRTAPAGQIVFLKGEDEVFGLTVSGASRAYPVVFLCYHHAVNDVLGGRSVAVFY